MNKTKELRERIAREVGQFANDMCWEDLIDDEKAASFWSADFILQVFKEAGGVLLAENQELPEGVFNYEQHERIFKEAGFQRVEEIKL